MLLVTAKITTRVRFELMLGFVGDQAQRKGNKLKESIRFIVYHKGKENESIFEGEMSYASLLVQHLQGNNLVFVVYWKCGMYL